MQTHLGLRLCLPLLRLFGFVLMTVLGPFRVKGSKHVPRTGGVLVLANHQSDIDPICVQVGCRRHIFFMAKSELFEMKGLGRVIRWFQAFPVRRGEPDRSAIKLAVQLLKAGEVVCVFPEGQLSPTGELLPILPGVALIARMAGVPVVPCGIKNSNRVMPYGSFVVRPSCRWVKVEFGSASSLPSPENAEEFLAALREQLETLRR